MYYSITSFLQKNNISALYSSLAPELLLTAYYYLKNEEDAKDVVSDVFERLLKLSDEELSDLLINDGIKGYLFIVVKHKCFDFMKVKKNRLAILQQVFYLINTKTNYDVGFEKDILEKIIAELPKREGEVLQLSVDGFKNEEIAKQLGISYNTVRNTLHEAKKKTRVLWDKYFN